MCAMRLAIMSGPKRPVKYQEVKSTDNALTSTDIINKLSGRDETAGSCASLSLAYIGNKCGLDVTDYRGGEKARKILAVIIC